MNYADNVISVIESIVAQMTPVITIDDSTDHGDSTYTLETCTTYWVHKLMKLTIDGVEYTVTDFVLNTSITISGASLPVVTFFQLDAPEFKHGSHRKVENERAEQINVSLPRVYLPVPTTRQPLEYDSDLAYLADIRPIFLLNYDEQRDTIDLQQDEVIAPANQMADLFYYICEQDTRFEDPENLTRREWMNFGDETVWGNDELIFDQPLSGVELRFTLEVFIDSYCECADHAEPDLCPDVTTSVESVATGVDTAPGQNIDIKIVDLLGVTVPSTLTENTANDKTLEVNTSGSPAANQVNGASKTDIPGGGSKNFIIRHEDDSAVVVTEVSDSATEFIGEVPNAALNTANPFRTGQTTSYRTGDDGDLEEGRGASWTVLDHNNGFGNTNRFTDELGGQTYTNDFVIDWSTWDQVNDTVIGWYRVILGPSSETWNEAIDKPLASTQGGYSDWRCPNVKELLSIFRFELSGGQMIMLDYAPFSYPITSSGSRLWTSTRGESSRPYGLVENGNIQGLLSTASYSAIMCRDFTFTDLGL